jgi:predicted ABC-type sugar transport system permease subunit
MRDLVALLLKPPMLAASGLLATAATIGLRRRKHRRWNPTLISMFAAFLAGTSFPYGIVLLLYPFVDPPPDLSSVSYYVALAGIALLWAGVM